MENSTEPIKILSGIAKPDYYTKRLRYSLILDRLPVFKYRCDGSLYTAEDSGFYNWLSYERWPSGRKAFGGRQFHITMLDGSKVLCQGNHWDTAMSEPPTVSVGYATFESLKECYVFIGGNFDAAAFREWLLTDPELHDDYYYWEKQWKK